MDNMEESIADKIQAGPCREKYWHELDDNGKIEKLGGVVTTLWHRVKELEHKNATMQKHTHMDGNIVIPISFSSSDDMAVWGYNFHPLNMKDKREG